MAENGAHAGGNGKVKSRENEGARLALTIDAGKASYRRGEKIAVEATLRNEGDRPLIVNARLGPNAPGFPGELFFEITGPGGRRVQFSTRVNIGKPRDEDFEAVEPGGSASKRHILQDYYNLTRAGKYSVKATYQNKWPGDDPAQKAWTGTLHSNEIEFEIEG